jgi:hypothetical protein
MNEYQPTPSTDVDDSAEKTKLENAKLRLENYGFLLHAAGYTPSDASNSLRSEIAWMHRVFIAQLPCQQLSSETPPAVDTASL